jgi:MoaA/NifB/PqqE/SkfB family radical SAM enzyme
MLKKIYLELTENCNLECDICFRHQWSEKPTDMMPGLLQSVIDQINRTKSLNTVVLGGIGEPLASPEFASTVEKLLDKEIWVTTNATLMKEVGLKHLINKIHLLIISIDGMEQQMLQGRRVVLKDLLANIDYVNSLKKNSESQTPFIDIQFVASKKNIDDIFLLMDVLV